MNANHLEKSKILIRYLEQHGRVPKDMATLIINETRVIEFKKRKHIVSPLDMHPNMYFILSGAARGFTREDGEDLTTWITIEGQIVGLTLFSKQFSTAKPQFIETIEPCQVILITNLLVKKLLAEYPEMSMICRKLLWQHYHDAEERNYLIRLNSAVKRLNRMNDTHPQFYHRIPLKYLASYLGMRIETLSRLRSQMLNSSTT
ncbi:CRP-like cAMP-binding protein [Pedobacter psychrotolerans]|uniref:CRP-like cAMP-binding protein n=1 Tax=Pedobacter psychrotolerans TaxID=1843235 RepID=A0A4R2H8K7_9SPHI|nr:Crp/Fnr family transcriptional regulator [Pedobacter psychrotolerans]TCO22578.1 CRP-like cAMP-binding protein [Pedobacter psychrotolerans]GGE65641.1 cyclic nucleotide-binding protein [Pedobacter psychrotolerans]